MQKKKILDPGIIIKSLSTGKFCRAQFVFILWSYCRLPRKVYQRVFPENGQSPVSRVSSERQGSPPNSHSDHRVRANTELKYLYMHFLEINKEPRKAIQWILGANGNNTH